MRAVNLMVGLGCGIVLGAVTAVAAPRQAPGMSGDPDGRLVLVRGGAGCAPIVVPEAPAPFIAEAAQDLAGTIEKISGARPEIIEGAPGPRPASAIYVGYQPILKELFPRVSFDFQHAEEILIVADHANVAICGRDLSYPLHPDLKDDPSMTTGANGYALDAARGLVWTEAGTSCAVYTFIEQCLNVRWLWVGGIGEDIVKSATIALDAFQYRHHPLFRRRQLWPRWMRDWYRRQRIWYYSNHWTPGHSFTDWWDKYHEAHPEYFALIGGKRQPPLWGPNPYPKGVKLCVSNPDVASQWLDNLAGELERKPWLRIGRASPNDGPGFCTCEKCRAMDPPEAEGRGRYSDRYASFWNSLARGLKQRFPDRDLSVGALAYSTYSEPPIATTLEDNVVIGFVGFFPNCGRASTERLSAQWTAWSKMAREMVYRPNLYKRPSRGGLELERTAQAMRFLAENRCVGMDVDTLPNSWAFHGPQYYLMAQLMYDPHKDAGAVLADYFRRGFGPAAEAVEQYFRALEKAHYRLLDAADEYRAKNDWDVPRDDMAVKLQALNAQTWNDMTLIAEAGRWMRQAEEQVAGAPDLYRKRLDYIKVGFDYLRLSAEIENRVARLQAGGFKDLEVAREALALCRERERLYESTWKSPGHYLRYSLSGRDTAETPEILKVPEFGRMRYLAEQKRHKELVAEFGAADFDAWSEATRWTARLLRAEACLRVGETDRAAVDYALCVEGMSPDEENWVKALDALVGIHAKAEAWETLSDVYRRALPRLEQSTQAKGNAYPMLLEKIGRALVKQGKYDEARDLLETRVDSIVRGETWKFNMIELLGDIHATQGAPQKARARYRQALDLYRGKTGDFYAQRTGRVTSKLEALKR